jgi:hypothetical protein
VRPLAEMAVPGVEQEVVGVGSLRSISRGSLADSRYSSSRSEISSPGPIQP